MSSIPDLSVLMQMMQESNMDFSSLMEQLNHGSSSHSNSYSENSDSNNSSNPDMETMMKMMQLMQAMNSSSNSASTNLLYALKPFLRDSKKERVDQCANFLKMSKVLQEMNKSGGDKN